MPPVPTERVQGALWWGPRGVYVWSLSDRLGTSGAPLSLKWRQCSPRPSLCSLSHFGCHICVLVCVDSILNAQMRVYHKACTVNLSNMLSEYWACKCQNCCGEDMGLWTLNKQWFSCFWDIVLHHKKTQNILAFFVPIFCLIYLFFSNQQIVCITEMLTFDHCEHSAQLRPNSCSFYLYYFVWNRKCFLL